MSVGSSPPAALTFLALTTELDDGFVQGQVAMDVSRCLLVIFTPQGCLHAVHAELQVQDVVSSLDGLVEAVLQGRENQCRLSREAEVGRKDGEGSTRGKRWKKQIEAMLLCTINN